MTLMLKLAYVELLGFFGELEPNRYVRTGLKFSKEVLHVSATWETMVETFSW